MHFTTLAILGFTLNLCQGWEYKHGWENDPAVYYKIPGYGRNFEQRLKRDEVETIAIASMRSSNCKNLPPGFHNLNLGINKLFFATRTDDEIQPSGEVFELNCLEIEKDGEKQVPVEVALYTTDMQTNIYEATKAFTSAEEVMTLNYDLVPFWRKFAANLPTLGITYNYTYSSISIVSSVVQSGTVKLRSDLTPTHAAMAAYYNLPTKFKGNELEFYRFAKTFGTHYADFAKLGGVLSVVAKHNNCEKSVEEFKHHVGSLYGVLYNVINNPSTSATSNRLMTLGGTLSTNRDFNVWEASVPLSPALIGGEFFPLYRLFRPNTTKQQEDEFKILIESERVHYTLKEKLVAIDKMDFTFQRYKFLKSVAQEEIKFVATHPVITSLLKEGLFELNKDWFIGCHHPPHWTADGDWWEGATKLHVMPGVCVTLQRKMENCDRGVDISFPPNVSCLLFFQSGECLGKGVAASHSEEMKRHFHSMKSFITCKHIAHHNVVE